MKIIAFIQPNCMHWEEKTVSGISLEALNVIKFLENQTQLLPSSSSYLFFVTFWPALPKYGES